MASPSLDKKHLVPLLEFLRFVSARGRTSVARFPKKINGGTELKREFSDSGSEQDSFPVSPDFMQAFTSTGSHENSPLLQQDSAASFSSTPEHRKRARTPESTAALAGGQATAPVECEVVLKSPGKGCFTSKYVDFPLRELGLRLLFDGASQPLTKEVAKHIQGAQCCYLLLGTSMVVTGDIVDVSMTSETVLVSPDRGLRVALEWVPLRRVYQVPNNIFAVREEATRRIQRIMDAERRGDSTPSLSPVQLAENPPPLTFPALPLSDEQEE